MIYGIASHGFLVLYFALLLAAAVCFTQAALRVFVNDMTQRVNMLALGLTLATLVPLISVAKAL